MQFLNSKQPTARTRYPMLIAVTIVIGIGSGICGIFLAMLLHAVQHIAYGYSPTQIISDESFLDGVRASSPERRICVLSLAGLIAGFGWWGLYRYGKPLISIATAVKSNHPQMPLITTIIHVFLQMITIALGSPLGREVAPRELSTLFAGWITAKTGLNLRETQIMIACAAGAGLSAVYNVPFGGALFALEVLLCTLSWSSLLPAFATTAIATLVSWIGLGNKPMYEVPNFSVNHSLITWSILAGPILGIAAYWFAAMATAARNKVKNSWQRPILCLLNFSLIGVLAIDFPSLLGNGKSPAQIEFDDEVSLGVTAILLFLRTLIVWSSLRSGAQGGLLTPSLANGALLGVLLGGLWNLIWPSSQLGAYAIIGATAFLAAAQKMPLTAIILIFELTRINFHFIIPILIAVTGAVGICRSRFAHHPK